MQGLHQQYCTQHGQLPRDTAAKTQERGCKIIRLIHIRYVSRNNVVKPDVDSKICSIKEVWHSHLRIKGDKTATTFLNKSKAASVYCLEHECAALCARVMSG